MSDNPIPHQAQNPPANRAPTSATAADDGFAMVDGSTPIPDGFVRFRIGAELHWQGLRMRLISAEGTRLAFQVIGVTGKAKKRLAKAD